MHLEILDFARFHFKIRRSLSILSRVGWVFDV